MFYQVIYNIIYFILQKFNARNNAINTFETEISGHSIKEVKALFARELISPEISENETITQKNSNGNQPKTEEIYFVPFIPWRSDEVLSI